MKNAMKKLETTLSGRCVQLSIVVGVLFYFNVIIFKYLDRFRLVQQKNQFLHCNFVFYSIVLVSIFTF